MIALLGFLDLDVVELHAVKDVACEFSAGAANIRPVAGMAFDRVVDPELGQRYEQRRDQQDKDYRNHA